MTTATLEKRVHALEAEVKTLKSVVRQTVRADLRAKIIEGLNSGPGTPVNAEYWKQKRSLALKVHKEAKVKKLPRWLQASLKDEKEGRVYGTFNTVKELMTDLNSPGK